MPSRVTTRRPIVICGTPEFGIESRAMAIAGLSAHGPTETEKRTVVWYEQLAAAFGHRASSPSDTDAALAEATRVAIRKDLWDLARHGYWNGEVWFVGHSKGSGQSLYIGGYSEQQFAALRGKPRPLRDLRVTRVAPATANFRDTVTGEDFAIFLRQVLPFQHAPKSDVNVVILACWIGDNKAEHANVFLRAFVPMMNAANGDASLEDGRFAKLTKVSTNMQAPAKRVLAHATKFETWYGNGNSVSVNGVRAAGYAGGDTWALFSKLKTQARDGTLEKGAFNIKLHQEYLETTQSSKAPPPKVLFTTLSDILDHDYGSVSAKYAGTNKRKYVFTTFYWSKGYGAVCRDKSNVIAREKANPKYPENVEVCRAGEWIDEPFQA